VFPYRFGFEQFGVTPKDAEFIALMEFAIEDVARAYRIPIEMVGGVRRTYQNNEVADVALWQRCLEPESSWIADELTSKLVPAFGLDPAEYFLGFDLSAVVALQDDESVAWARDRERYMAALAGLQAMGTRMVQPSAISALYTTTLGFSEEEAAEIVGDGPPDIEEPAEESPAEDAPPAPPPPATASVLPAAYRVPRASRAAPEFGSEAHRGVMRKADDAMSPYVERFGAETARLMRAQEKSILAKLGDLGDGERAARLGLSDFVAVFNRARWIKQFREMAQRELRAPMQASGNATYDDLGADGAYDPSTPPAVRALRQRSQRFATEVNATTWTMLKGSLEEAITGGETPRQMADRVRTVMGSRIRSSGEVIARTEVHGSYQEGSRIAAKQTGLALNKVWVSALDSRVRNDHEDAHGQTVGLDEDFKVGSSRGPGPGDMGSAAMISASMLMSA